MIYQSSISASASAVEAAPSSPLLDEASAKALMDKVNHDGLIQAGFDVVRTPKVQSNDFLISLLTALSNFLKALGRLLEPLGPVLPYLAVIFIVLLVGFILSPLVRLMLRQKFERFWPARHRLKADEVWVPTQAAVSALLSEIDAMAARGEYDEAVHFLLYRTLADLNRRRSDLVKPHFTAREILSHPLLPKAAYGPFGLIVGWVEQSYFAGIAVGQGGFEACRAAYVEFLTRQGLRAEKELRAESLDVAEAPA